LKISWKKNLPKLRIPKKIDNRFDQSSPFVYNHPLLTG
jgi:hypothetical protein